MKTRDSTTNSRGRYGTTKGKRQPISKITKRNPKSNMENQCHPKKMWLKMYMKDEAKFIESNEEKTPMELNGEIQRPKKVATPVQIITKR